MAVKIPRMAVATVPVPVRPDVVELFFDTADDVLKFKDSKGVVRTAIAVEGSPISLAKQASAPAAAANTNKLYAREVSGNLEVFAKDDDNQEVQLTDQGGPAAVGGSVGVFWDAYDQLKVDISTTDKSLFVPMPTPVSPPPGQWCFYVVTVRTTGVAEQGWPFAVGGAELDLMVLFNANPGTPDVRFYGIGDGFLGDVDFAGAPIPTNLTVDAAGVLTLELFNPANPTTTAGKLAATVAGPFVHPEMVAPIPT